MSGMIKYEPKPESPIGVFDSGLGGLSTLKTLRALMPNEDFVFYGDHANAPYGSKPVEEVRTLSFACAGYLLCKCVKAIVIACNTATAAAVKPLREECPFLPIIGAEPAIKPAVLEFPGSDIIVMATERTLSGEKYRSLSEKYKNDANIIPAPFPGLVEFVENGITDGEELEDFISEKLKSYLTQNTKAIVLGCTHYPFVAPVIQRVAGENIKLFDGNTGIACQVRRKLEEHGLVNPSKKKGKTQIEGSGRTEKIKVLTYKLLSEGKYGK